MHRRVKGLLSLALAVVMVTVASAPAFAEELLEEHPIEGQPIAEMKETEPAPEQDMAEAVSDEAAEEPAAEQTELIEELTTEEAAPVEEQSTEQNVTVTETEEESSLEEESSTEEYSTAEVVDAEPASDEPSGTVPESTLSPEEEQEYWYDSILNEEQKKFIVYTGTQPLTKGADTNNAFLSTGIIPDDEFLDTQSGTLLKTFLLEYRPGDFNFYRLSGWNVWSVDGNGAPQSAIATHSYLSRVATKANFLKAAYMKNNGIGTDPQIEFQNPILEPVWSCLDYPIPVYDADGNDTGTPITVNAENYSNLSFPEVKADSWKLVYGETECELNAASEIWTNQTNGIKTIGRDFSESKARLQAVVSQTTLKEGSAEFAQPDWYEGAQKPEPIVSSATNGIENITYFYKEAGADDSTYTAAVPEKAGAYTAAAVFAATEEYTQVIKTADFNILPAVPDMPELQEGSADFTQPDWYEGQPMAAPIVSSATNGIENITYFYKEAEADDSTYTTTVPEKAGAYIAAAVFAATEEYKEVIKFANFNILPNVPAEEADNTAPIISGVSGGLTYYGDQTITITDEHLKTVTVNGQAVAITDNCAGIVLKPSEDIYIIAAADEAGNQVEYTVEVLEIWVRDGINDDGKKKLKSQRIYKLGSGQWTVDGDNTVYGSGSFYVKYGGEYDFKRK